MRCLRRHCGGCDSDPRRMMAVRCLSLPEAAGRAVCLSLLEAAGSRGGASAREKGQCRAGYLDTMLYYWFIIKGNAIKEVFYFIEKVF